MKSKQHKKWETWNTFISTLLTALIAFGWIGLLLSGSLAVPPAGSSAVSGGQEKKTPESRNFLLIGGSREDGIAIALLRLDTRSRMMSLSMLPPEWETEYKGRRATLNGHYSYGGARYLYECVKETIVPADAYAAIRKNSIAAVIDQFGGLPVHLPGGIEGETGVFSEGVQVLSGEDSLGLLEASEWPEGIPQKRRVQAQAVASFLNEYVTERNVAAAYHTFPALINLVETNLSITDRETLRRLFECMTQEGRAKCAVYPIEGEYTERGGVLYFEPEESGRAVLELYR